MPIKLAMIEIELVELTWNGADTACDPVLVADVGSVLELIESD